MDLTGGIRTPGAGREHRDADPTDNHAGAATKIGTYRPRRRGMAAPRRSALQGPARDRCCRARWQLLGDTGPVTASLFAAPRRSGSDIRAALAQHAPAELDDFEREFHDALKVAASSYDTVPIEGVLDQWWRIAVQRSITLTEDEHDHVRRAAAGDFTGLWEQASDGSFRRVE
jgi:hypothetical protein